MASSLHNLGITAQRRGDLERALDAMREALEIKRRLAPGTETVANSLLGLGETSYEAGHFADAERATREALAVRERIAPGSLRCAQSRVLLGKILVAAGRFDEGEAVWREGLAALDRAHDTLDFSAQRRSVFVTRFQDLYRDLVAVYAREGRVADAFALLEHSRARALRDSAGRGGVYESLGVLDLDGARAVLDVGTRLVLYSVSRDDSLVMVVDADGVSIVPLPVGRAELRRRLEIFHALIERGRQHPRIEDALLAQARDLYDLLLAPIADRLEGAGRLVVVPDGPLTTLPFAALSRPDGRWVAEHPPLSYAVSATVLAHAKARRPSGGPARLTLVARSTDGARRLPGVAEEATRIARRAAGRSRLLLDDAAREAALIAALQAPGDGGIVHVAAHATVDDEDPFASALHLAPGSGEDGVLTAHEILDQLSVTSDLVVLSACNTGRGRELGSEGVHGLSHALLFAGARTLVTSLWPVTDPSTAGWMTAFYDQLDRGAERDEAIQHAQLRGIAAGDHPVHWAAFRLWGDWGARRDPLPVSFLAESSEAGSLDPRRR